MVTSNPTHSITELPSAHRETNNYSYSHSNSHGNHHFINKQNHHHHGSTNNLTTSSSNNNNSTSSNTNRVSFQPSTQFNRQYKQVGHTKLGGDAQVRRQGSLYQKGYLPRSESILQYEKIRMDAESSIRNYIEEKKESNLIFIIA